MLDSLKADRWKTIYSGDFLQKIKFTEKYLQDKDIKQAEYWYVLMFTSAMRMIKSYYASKGEIHFKNKDILSCAIRDNLVVDAESWLNAYKLTERIGRAVRAKDENLPVIAESMIIFYKLSETFETLVKDSEG